MKVLAIVESMTQNTMSFVEYAKNKHPEVDFVTRLPIEKLEADEVSKYDKIMLGAYTWGAGKIPKRMKEFIIENREILLTQDILIFGSGWSVYSTYCWAVDSMNVILEEKYPKAKFELRFDESVEVEAVETLEKFINGE